MNKGKSVFGPATALVLLAALAFWLFELNPFSSEITVYSVYCGKDRGDQGACINLSPITYEASLDRQAVAYWTDTGTPATLADCTVRDRKNWECWYKGRAGRLSMVGGEFSDEIRDTFLDRDVFDSVRYVPKWKWWSVRIGIRTESRQFENSPR